MDGDDWDPVKDRVWRDAQLVWTELSQQYINDALEH